MAGGHIFDFYDNLKLYNCIHGVVIMGNNAKQKMKSPLGKALGLGSAKSGTSHWLHQRTTALALIPLCIWFVIFMIWIVGEPYEVVKESFSSTFNASAFILFVSVMFYHGYLGMQVILEDYIHCELTKFITINVVKYLGLGLTIVAVLSVLKIYLR